MEKGKICLAAAMMAVLFLGGAYATTVALQPGPEGKDAYIRSSGGGTGDKNRLVSGFANAEVFWTLIEFDLDSLNLTNTTNITNASLWFYCNYTNGSNDYSVYQADGGWDEDTVTWSTRPAVGEYYDTKTVQYGYGLWYYWSVTQHVRDVVGGTIENNGLILKTPFTEGIASFHSSDYMTNPLLRPMLEITYT